MQFSHTKLSCAILCLLSHNGQAKVDDKLEQESNVSANLHTIVITADENKKEVGKTTYSKEDLQNTPNSQKTITDFLKVNPNVQFSNKALAGGQQGELSAAEVSINGALFYENKFLLNNVNIGNSMNPADGSGSSSADVGGGSLNANVNTDLICELEVLDSNVSAEYGGFTGGVIKAKTCAPKTEVGKVHGSLSYDYTSSDWTKFSFLSEDERGKFDDNTDSNYQKDFVKQGASATVYGRASDKVAISLSAARRWSDIDLKSRFSDTLDYNQTRQEDNFSGNLYYDINENNKLKFGLYYQNSEKNQYNPMMLNSGYQNNKENLSFEAEHEYKFTGGVLTQSVVIQKQDNQRDSDSNISISWNASKDKNWSTGDNSEGGFGDLTMLQNSWEYNLKAVFDEVKWGGVHHKFSAGAGYAHADAKWDRPEDAYSYFIPSKAYGGLGASTCTHADGSLDQFCDLTYVGTGSVLGQYNATRNMSAAGTIEAQKDSWSAFIEDQMSWNDRIKMRIGVRQDYDSISKNYNVAPRANLQYFPFANESLGFTAGWNRYFSNNAFYTKLQDSMNLLDSQEKRSSLDADWISDNKVKGTNVKRSELDTPYTDEMMFAIHSNWKNWNTQLKYVHRDNKDQIRRNRISLSPIEDVYDNTGSSKADTITLSIFNQKPFELLGTKNQFNFGFDYTDVQRNFTTYDDNVKIDLTYQQYILYQGAIIDESTRPASNFAQPWTIRAGLTTQFDRIPLKITNFLRYRADHDAIIKTSIPKADQVVGPDGNNVKSSYDMQSLGSSINWDLRASYDWKLGKNEMLTFGLTVNNVTNRHNKYASENTSSSNNGASGVYSEAGRQFVADLTYKF